MAKNSKESNFQFSVRRKDTFHRESAPITHRDSIIGKIHCAPFRGSYYRKIRFLWTCFALTAILSCIPDRVSAKQIDETTITGIEGEGVTLFSNEQLFMIFSRNGAFKMKEDSIKEGAVRILEAYSENGYPFARIDSSVIFEEKNGAVLRLYFEEGPKLKIRTVSFTGNTTLPDNQLQSLLGIKPGRVWEKNAVHRGIDRIEQEYRERGFPFCSVHISDTVEYSIRDLQTEGIPLCIQVDEGRTGRADSILFKGINYTRLSVMKKQTGLSPGQLLNKSRLDAAERNLNRLSFLDYVSSPRWVLLPGDRTGILFEVKEGSPNNFSGILGYLPSRGTSRNGVITGDITVQFGNIFGTGRRLTGRWARRDESSQDFEFRYNEPWLLGGPVHLDLYFAQAIQDSSYLKRGIGIESHYRVTQSFSILGSVEKFTTIPEAYGAAAYRLRRFSSLMGSAGLSYDTRDHPTNPRKGLYNRFALSIAQRDGGLTGQSSVAHDEGKALDRSIVTECAVAIPVTFKQVAYFYFYAAQLSSGKEEIPYSQWFTMGGAKSLRGYREMQFRSTSMGWWNLEYRFLPERLSRFFIFFDGGFYKIVRESESEWSQKYAYGAGFRINSRLGIIGMDYGIGEEGGFSAGKIHLSIENRF